MNDWDQLAVSWDGDEIIRSYASAAFASLEQVLAAHGMALPGSRVLDFGCGTGLLTAFLVDGGAAVDAVDTSAGMLNVLRAKIKTHGWTDVSATSELPVGAPTRPYDLIVCSSVCAFLDDYPAVVAQLVRMLRRGGLFVQWDWERDDPDDAHGLTRDEIRSALTAAGLANIRVQVGFENTIPGYEETMRPLLGEGRLP
ncbi:MAG: class I SAM-dependent methyltransferase [Actinobacteria bacterium]|nr:class I SAM-dependent methyltransferase [Actinomycetota bacterium]